MASIDVRRLARWMDERGLPGWGDVPTVSGPLAGGSQNQLDRVERGGVTMAMRRPGPGSRAATLRREIAVLRALAGSDVPHADLIAGCPDEAVLGTPFYLMRFVDGWSPITLHPRWPEPFENDLTARAGLGKELVDGIARLARVDWQARGLDDLGRPVGFHDRQVDRWLSFLADFRFRELPGLDDAAEWLRGHRPRHWTPGIMHGDYQFANVMFAHGAPARLAAIIDWEMATVGDPLLDLGWCLSAWGREADDTEYMRPLDLDGMPSRDDLLQHYASVSGRAVDDIDYYVVLARFKLAIVLEKTVAREGTTSGSGQVFDPIVRELMRKAASLAASTP